MIFITKISFQGVGLLTYFAPEIQWMRLETFIGLMNCLLNFAEGGIFAPALSFVVHIDKNLIFFYWQRVDICPVWDRLFCFWKSLGEMD